MSRLVSVLIVITCVLQATNGYIVSVNDHARDNSTNPLILNHVDEKHNLPYTQGLINSTLSIASSNFQDFLTRILSQNVNGESSNDHGIRLARSTTRRQKSYIDCQGHRNTEQCRTQWKCFGKRLGRRSNRQTGSSTRLKGRRNRRKKTASCRPTIIEDKETSEKEEKYYTSIYCPVSKRHRSKRAPNCDPTNLSTNNKKIRDNIIQNLIKDDYEILRDMKLYEEGYETTEGPIIFHAIEKIEVGQKISKDKPLIVVKDQKLLSILEDSSYHKMKQLRQAWTINSVEATKLRNEFSKLVSGLIGMENLNTDPLTNAKMKHIFLGEPRDTKNKKEFSGLHDGSAFLPGGAHNIVGGVVVGVKNIGPGMVVHIMEPKVEWNRDDGDVRSKGETTMFIGVPSNAQAAFYLTTFYEGKGNIAVALTEPGQEITAVTDPIIIEVNKNIKNNNEVIGNAYPYFMHGEQYEIYRQIKKQLQ